MIPVWFKTMIAVLSSFAIILISARSVYACNGYGLKIHYIRPCFENGIVSPKNVSVILDKDCNVIFTGCIEVTKTVSRAVGTYEINKPPMPSMKGPMDFCQIASKTQYPQIQQSIRALGLPNKCPMTAGLKCGKGEKINLGSMKNQIGIAAGTTTVKLDFEHGDGKSCIESSITISKIRTG